MLRSLKHLALLLLLSLSLPALAQDILWKETTIPMPEAGPKGLETLLVWPNTPGKHPLALISHGSPRDASQREAMSAISALPVAMEFARRGFAVAYVLRRGYGHSGGDWAESYGSCNDTHYLKAAHAGSADLHAALRYLAKQPQFDLQEMIAVGYSAGGFATLALTADSPPKGLVAALLFAPGRGSTEHDSVCQEDALVAAFGDLGKTSRTPMLWVYAQNDHYFNTATAEKFYQAFKAAGGHVNLQWAPAYGDEGHMLFSRAGIPDWTPILDDFLKSHDLVLVDKLLPPPFATLLKAPTQLTAENKKQFLRYLASPPHKAFAIGADGAFGWRSGRYSVAAVEKEAIATCEQYSRKGCHLYAVDNNYAAKSHPKTKTVASKKMVRETIPELSDLGLDLY